MKKTFVTSMPNHIGAFLKASRCFTALGVNITRVSYNKAVDSHMLFLDAEGTEAQLRQAALELDRIGYTQYDDVEKTAVMLQFRLPDAPGSVTTVLELVSSYHFNISYISTREKGTGYQFLKLGLVVDDKGKLEAFLAEAQMIYPVQRMDYSAADTVFDNSVFYTSFVSELSEAMDLPAHARGELMVCANLAMQNLDELGISPYRTFDSISRFTELLSASRGHGFCPRITEHTVTEQTRIILIEPPCGSNIAIIRSGGETLFVDTGYACHQREVLPLIRQCVPDFDTKPRRVLLTHADVDHCGLLPLFDEILTSRESAESLRREYENRDGLREQLRLHQPYVRMCKLLTAYQPPNPEKLTVIGEAVKDASPLAYAGCFDFGDLHFTLLEGQGGHVAGELVLVDYEHCLAFTGDIFINLKDMTPEQAEYNRYAPILMTSVDTDKVLCAKERQAIFRRLGTGSWQIFCGHGGKVSYNVRSEK